MKISANPAVTELIESYPAKAQKHLLILQKLIIECADELELREIEETLKWGEPSYLTKNGSTIRINWKAKDPDYYSMYFKCTSRLVPVFRNNFQDIFHFEGNREIKFPIGKPIPTDTLKRCIKVALQYHLVKDLPDLGI